MNDQRRTKIRVALRQNSHITGGSRAKQAITELAKAKAIPSAVKVSEAIER
jgi:hypothetical protein